VPRLGPTHSRQVIEVSNPRRTWVPEALDLRNPPIVTFIVFTPPST